jgi:hypothetical protein
VTTVPPNRKRRAVSSGDEAVLTTYTPELVPSAKSTSAAAASFIKRAMSGSVTWQVISTLPAAMRMYAQTFAPFRADEKSGQSCTSMLGSIAMAEPNDCIARISPPPALPCPRKSIA